MCWKAAPVLEFEVARFFTPGGENTCGCDLSKLNKNNKLNVCKPMLRHKNPDVSLEFVIIRHYH
jgi:hypothetical protein